MKGLGLYHEGIPWSDVIALTAALSPYGWGPGEVACLAGPLTRYACPHGVALSLGWIRESYTNDYCTDYLPVSLRGEEGGYHLLYLFYSP